jgi:hypothetical protein
MKGVIANAMGRMTIGRATDEPFTAGRRERSVEIVGLIAASDVMPNIDEVLALVGRRTKLIVGPGYAVIVAA